ncbi:hypothetical protein HanXRQr2_Chr09g0416701 [Helianthus annuus]|uniref:Uncharacterized protein n=1 Tax=Helianthus annuus TaxID=4232 RepID=A0A9K3NBF1_HELAN|nr:hypothetical protein HanXRQr2_Chr09g0416701 [Helianthus annuus]KAJ0895650.1 hypothetical protein HanPSC8_Chr09g0402951 [Helianthus annuus]
MLLQVDKEIMQSLTMPAGNRETWQYLSSSTGESEGLLYTGPKSG